MSAATKTPCNITRSYFATEAKALVVEIKSLDGTVLCKTVIQPREFSTQSLGWNASQAVHIDITPSTNVKCQLGLNLTIANSKELPKS
jgi:hypothetical protein